MISLSGYHFDPLATLVGDTPFTVTPFFHLRRKSCDVYADAAEQPRYGAIIPHTPYPDVYVFGATSLERPAVENLASFLARLDPVGGFLVPVDLVPPIRAHRRIYSEVEGLCFIYRQLPREFRVWRPDLVRQLDVSAAPLIEALPAEAGFLFHHYDTPQKLLSEGLAFGVFHKGRLVSLATSLALTPRHCDVGVYTLPRFRNRGYATDCVEALFSCLFDRGIKPLWRIGVQQKVALYFAEKLGMDEIGTDGREVYLQACPSC